MERRIRAATHRMGALIDDLLNLSRITRTELTKQQVDEIRGRLYAAREQRVHPGRDDKVVTSWNALMTHVHASEELFTVGGVWRAEVRRTPDGWRFSRVTVEPVWTSGEPPVVAASLAWTRRGSRARRRPDS